VCNQLVVQTALTTTFNSYGDRQISSPYKIDTPEPIDKKFVKVDCTKEIKRRTAMARQKAVVLASIWKDRNIKTATKVKVMKSLVWAVF